MREEESFLMLLHNAMAINVKCSFDICTNNNVEAGEQGFEGRLGWIVRFCLRKFINIKYIQKDIALYIFTRSYSTAKIL